MSATRPVVIQSYSSDQIQAHLYESFIHGRTADVSLIVEGDAWHATYSLHRVVLIQAGFFQSLFTSGFSEMHARSTSPSRGMDGADIIEVQFDDPNITRAAFEICIARLYGGGPSLSVSPGFQSTPAHPLTPSFPSPPPPDPAPPNHHPATPRFLLSLLATATYLSIPSVSALALSLLLSSIGPYTVVRYLNFAIGKGIGPPDDNEPPCAVGLEHIGKEEASTSSGSSVRSNNDAAPDSPINGAARKMSAMTVRSSSTSSTDEGEGDGDQETYRDNTGDDSGPMFYYGAVSDKIGESCACWLARWGTDILPLEETYAGIALDVPETTSTLTHSQSTPIPTTSTSSSFIIVAPIASSAAARRATLPSSLSAPEPHLLRTTHSFVPPTLWNVGGLTPIWVRGVISSDVFFVKGNPLELSRRGPSSEWERYKFATRVVELRRCSGGGEGEETEWEKLFENGIYYSHMTFEDLLLMGQDISPSTKKPYVPLHVLQSAHWNQSIFRSQIMASRSSSASNHPLSRSNSPSPTPASTANDLGMVLNTSDVTMSTSDIVSGEAPKTFFPVPGDSSVRIGDSSSAPTEPGASPRGGKVHRNPADESNFFGIGGSRKTVKGVMDDDPTGKGKWCKNEPFRFSVEFWGVESLSEKRLHSHTVWYAGSFFNVYLQVVRKKEKGQAGQALQLGLYLHRQSMVDPIPAASAPPPVPSPLLTRLSAVSGERQPSNISSIDIPSSSHVQSNLNRPGLRPSSSHSALRPSVVVVAPTPMPPPTNPNLNPNATSGSPLPSSPSALHVKHTSTPTSTPLAPLSPYRDPRSAIKAYFSISCPSITGTSLTIFSSAPDIFSVGQSWGWKSSSALDVGGEDGDGKEGAVRGRECSVRATVIMGLV